jgi:glycosyltransferase involved in cell wall biosynthesis
MRPEEEYPLVSALFITYKRVDHLQRAVESFRQNTAYPNLEIVIADDGSGSEIQERIRRIRADQYALSPKNGGLGANNNAGFRLCHGKYVLMIQDDWACHGPPEYLANVVKVMEANPEVGIINFAGEPNPPDFAMPLNGSPEPCFITPRACTDGRHERYIYSDQPHLQSMESFRFTGPYNENRADEPSRAEEYYCRLWKEQTRYRTAVFPAYRLKVFQCDESARSFRKSSFRNRSIAAMLPIAQRLKRSCWPVYRVARAIFYSFIRVVELLGVVR